MNPTQVLVTFSLSNEQISYSKEILGKIPFFARLFSSNMREITEDGIKITVHDVDCEIFSSLYFFVSSESHHQMKFIQTVPFNVLCTLIILMNRFGMDNHIANVMTIFEDRLKNPLNLLAALEAPEDPLILRVLNKKFPVVETESFDENIVYICEHLKFNHLLKILELCLNLNAKIMYLTKWIVFHPLEIHELEYRNFMEELHAKHHDEKITPMIFDEICKMNTKLLTSEFVVCMEDLAKFLSIKDAFILIFSWTKQNFLTNFPHEILPLISKCYKILDGNSVKTWMNIFDLFATLIVDAPFEILKCYYELGIELSRPILANCIIIWCRQHAEKLTDETVIKFLHDTSGNYKKILFDKRDFELVTDGLLSDFYLHNCQVHSDFNLITQSLMPKSIGRHSTVTISIAPQIYNELLLTPFKIIKDDEEQTVEISHVNLPFRKIPIFYIPHVLTHGVYEINGSIVKALIKFQRAPDYDLMGDLELLTEKLRHLVLQAKPNVNVKGLYLYKDGLIVTPSETVQSNTTGVILERDLWKYQDNPIDAYGVGFTLRIVIITNKKTSNMICSFKKIMINGYFDIGLSLAEMKKRIKYLSE